MQQLSIVQDYILHAILNHRVLKPMGAGNTVWAGVDFARDVSVLSNEHDVVQDLYEALEDWLLMTIRNGDPVPAVDGIDLNSEHGQRLIAWHASHGKPTEPDQSWFSTPEWQAREREASREIELGETTVHESDEDFMGSLRVNAE
jgi:hypothetical protein